MKIIKLVVALALLLTGCSSQKKVNLEDALTDQLATIYISTVNEEPVNRVEKESKDAEFKIVYTDGTSYEVLKDEEENYPMTIKGRGNSTWGFPTTKKPYNLKFDEKVDLFGFGKAKKWSLIACWLDTSLMRSYMGYTLAKTLDETTPDCQMVQLVINNQYEGIYMFCEAYGIDKYRVETVGDGKDLNQDGEITEFLIEADVRAEEHDEPNRFLTPSNNWLVVKEPDEEEILDESDSRFTYIKDLFDQVDQAIVNKEGYEQYIDLDSLASQYVINEYIKNPDYGFGSQPYYGSTFMYLEEGGKIYFGPFWDCDIAFGRNDYSQIVSEGYRQTASSTGYLSKSSHWISQLMEEEAFQTKVKEKWALLKPEVEKMISTTAPEMMEILSSVASYDFKAHNETYKKRTVAWGGRDALDFKEEYNYVLNFMKERLTWMDQEFGQ